MKPRRTHRTTTVFGLLGGTEDNDLWVEPRTHESGPTVLASTWEPSEEERAAIAAGANIELQVFGEAMPPVNVRITTVPLGKAPTGSPAGSGGGY